MYMCDCLAAPARFCDGIHERLPWHRCAEIHVLLATPMSCHRYCTPPPFLPSTLFRMFSSHSDSWTRRQASLGWQGIERYYRW